MKPNYLTKVRICNVQCMKITKQCVIILKGNEFGSRKANQCEDGKLFVYLKHEIYILI